jgi:hypothetical protein
MVRTSRNQIATFNDCDDQRRVPEACRCVADQCGMWRWTDPELEKRDQKTWWPEEDYPQVEPPRPEAVPADAAWVPLSGEGDDLQGGCWEELQATVDAEHDAAMAKRRGYCGLAGAPVIQKGAK